MIMPALTSNTARARARIGAGCVARFCDSSGRELLGSDGIVYLDGRLCAASVRGVLIDRAARLCYVAPGIASANVYSSSRAVVPFLLVSL